ncbi:F-box/LRR protein [Trifolium pratense]|uniref:F-box/LRR protein n=4 Tax=Trifolium pratense TaxID=57577 RepID=A0A2K3LG28_TRIPR|nr:F-box/LRR protein [Trifolium pratense]
MATREELYLPDDCWESIFKIFLNDCDNNRCFLPSLSVVSKQFLSVTDSCKLSLTISDQTLPLLPRLFQRFTKLTSLDLTGITGDQDALLTQISCFPLQVKSLSVSSNDQWTIPANGLRIFSQKITTLTSLVCSNIFLISKPDLYLVADSFPLLEELELAIKVDSYDDSEMCGITLALPKLRKVNLSGSYHIYDSSLLHLCKNCEFLEEVVMFHCKNLTAIGIASAIRERPNLRSFSITLSEAMNIGMEMNDSLRSMKRLSCLDLSFSCISDQLLLSLGNKGVYLRRLVLRHCTGYSYTGILYLLSMSCFLQHLDLENATFLNDCRVAKLCEIRMEYTDIGKFGVEKFSSSTDFTHMEMKSLHLANNSFLNDETLKWFASIFPNLQLLDVNKCHCISDEGIVEVLRSCKIVHLNLSSCENVNLHAMNFQVPMLEVLNLSYTRTDDKTLDAISKSCSGLLHLDLEECINVSDMGVKQVIENCTRLKEINLRYCGNMAADVDIWLAMVLSRPSLRKIKAPSHFYPQIYTKWKPLLDHGCFLCP